MNTVKTTLLWAILASTTAATPAYAQTLSVATAGGPYGEGIKSEMLEPAGKELGVEVRQETLSDGLAAVRLQVMSGTVTTDVVHLGSGEGARAGGLGILEPIDYAVVDAGAVSDGMAAKYCYPFDSYGTVMAWNTKTYADKAPQSWADFWDVEKFPGRRAMRANAQNQIEAALLADGVAPGDVYKVLREPGGLERAIEKLKQIAPHVTIWWTSGAQSVQILKDGEADMVITWNGRAQNAVDDGAAAQYTFNQSVIGTDCFGVPKGSANAAAAMKLIAAMTTAERTANLSKHILYGPVNQKAYADKLVPQDRLAKLATAPGNVEGALYVDNEWWQENGEAAQLAFDSVMSK